MKRLLSILTALALVLTLVGCAPSNSDKAKAKMEKAGFTVAWTANKEVTEEGEVGYLTAVKGSGLGSMISGALDGNGLTATLYDTAAHAKAAYNSSKNAEGKTNWTLAGKWVFYGSDEAVKAFKK